MRWRWIVAAVMIAAAVGATIVADPATFTSTQTLEPPANRPDVQPDAVEVRLECTRDGGTFMSDVPDWVETNPDSLCGAERAANQRTGVTIAMVLLAGSIGLLLIGPLYQRLFDKSPMTAFRGIP
jgi:hypothetical protein